jgi:hypothetical protein
MIGMKTIQKIVRDVRPHWVGDGFPVRSLFSYNEGNAFDPFLLLDYAGPHEFPPTSGKPGVGEHPHRGFETVTLVYQGELDHRDSSGSHGSIGPGDVQWMTAGSGIVHEEFHSERFSQAGGTLEMVQLWVNLRSKDKLSRPGYQGILDSQISKVSLPEEAGTARVIAGELMGTAGAAKTFTPINVWDLELNSGRAASLTIPHGHTSLLVVQTGTVRVNETPLQAVELALFDRRGDVVRVEAESRSRVLVLTGMPINEPVVGQGPFVMNTREEIHEAIQDYQAGRMGHLT